MNINELSQEEFDALTPEELRERGSKLDAEQSDDDLDNDSEEDIEDTADEQEGDNADDEEVDQEKDETDSEEDDENLDEEVEQVQKEEVETPKAKAPKQDKQAKEVETTTEEDPKAFYDTVTASFKAAGKEYTIKDPKDIVSLVQKGINFTQKMQQISHLQGLNEILTQHGLSDPEELAFLIDVKNGKPEAIAKLIQQHKIDTYDLDEDKAASYQQTTVDIGANSKVVQLREIVSDNSTDENFNTVLGEARKWDKTSQEYLVDNPHVFETLRDHKANGTYDQIMSEVNRQNIVNPSNLPIMQQYIEVGNRIVGTGGGSAHNTQQPKVVTKERVIVKRGNVEEQRKRVASNKSGNGKRNSVSVRTAADLNNLSSEDFNKLSLEDLRRIK